MKTPLLHLIAAAALTLMTSTTALACGDSTSCSMQSSKFHNWEGIEFGMNGFLNPSRTLALPTAYRFLELDQARSFSFAWNIWQQNIHLYRNNVNLVTGIGLEWNSYAFSQNVTLQHDVDPIAAVVETRDFSKNKLKMTYVNVPLMLEFNTNNNNPNRSFHIAAGGVVGYNIFQNRLKQEYTVDGDTQERKVKDDFNINPFRYGLTARVGYDDLSLFVNYSLSEVFRTDRGPKLNHYSVGIHLSL